MAASRSVSEPTRRFRAVAIAAVVMLAGCRLFVDLDGIVGEVMYPSLNMFTFGIKDRDVVQAVFERHNDWVVDYCSVNPERLLGIG